MNSFVLPQSVGRVARRHRPVARATQKTSRPFRARGSAVSPPHPGPLPTRCASAPARRVGCGGGELRLYETLQLEIITVIESPGRLRESPDYELCQISEKKPGVLDKLAAERARLLEKESEELEEQASRLAEEIRELGGEEADRIL